MTLSPNIQRKIYVAATIGYGRSSQDPQEGSYYNQVKEEMKRYTKSSHG